MIAIVQPEITIDINGEEQTIPHLDSLKDLISYLGIGMENVAVELNRTIIRRKDWDKTAVRDHDRLEIVRFVGGG